MVITKLGLMYARGSIVTRGTEEMRVSDKKYGKCWRGFNVPAEILKRAGVLGNQID